MSDVLVAGIVQMEHRATVTEALAVATRMTLDAVERGAGLVLLPEYFFAGRGDGQKADDYASHAEDVRGMLRDASADAGAAVAGNLVERREGALFNTLAVFDRGRFVAEQRKIHPMPREAAEGIAGGDELDVFNVGDVPVGGLVCADIFYPEAARVLSLRGAEVLLNPVMSPYYTPDPTKDARESVYVARAWDSGAFVLKAGGFTRDEPRVVGRSLVASPWGLVAHYADEFREEVIVASLDLEKLRKFRDGHRGFRARAPKVYGALFEG